MGDTSGTDNNDLFGISVGTGSYDTTGLETWNPRLTLKGQGELLLGSSTLTGTASQKLQVTGGAYVSGSVGIGTTNPQRKLHLRATGADGIFLDNSDQTGNSGGQILRVRGQRVEVMHLRVFLDN